MPSHVSGRARKLLLLLLLLLWCGVLLLWLWVSVSVVCRHQLLPDVMCWEEDDNKKAENWKKRKLTVPFGSRDEMAIKATPVSTWAWASGSRTSGMHVLVPVRRQKKWLLGGTWGKDPLQKYLGTFNVHLNT